MIRTEEEHLAHYGILRKSGRYPWGSGETQYIRNKDFLDYVAGLKKQGMTDAQIARGQNISRNDLTAARTIALAEQKQSNILMAQRLREKGYSHQAIAERMGLAGESSARALLAPGEADKATALQKTADMLKRQIEEKEMVDVGVHVNHQVGVTRNRLDTAVAVLKEQGYTVHNIQILQIGTGKYTTMKVLAPPGTTLQYVQQNRAKIRQITEHSVDHGRSFIDTQPPISVSSKRLHVNYAEDNGGKADGVIYVRPGIDALSIGSGKYSQVRIAVDGTHYLKGMAVYKDNLPPGVDLVFNTKKSKSEGWKTDNNKISDDPELPFGSIIRQIHGPDGKVSSAMNLVGSPTKEGSGEEGQWDTWSRNLPSQFLSKQSPELAKQQLNVTFQRRQNELKEINSLTNPTVKQDLLIKFGDQTDAASVHLKAASLPRQATKVLLPIPSMKPDEIYVPSMRDGERVALVRFPHGGTFEIPQLTVNNRNREARKMLGTGGKNSLRHDAVGIHHSVAERLSGADFDGDTVLVIPNNRKLVKSTAALEGLKDFDPQKYKLPKDSPIPRMDTARKGMEMGKISNLITDMTIKKANTEELSRAIKHSMVVIDAQKHELDFKQSERDHNILQLKEKYQGSKGGGAQTLISKAGSQVHPFDRVPRSPREGGPIDPATGMKVFTPTGRMVPVYKTRKDPITGKKIRINTGVMERKRFESKALAETQDAFELSSGTHIEEIYAEHSNKLKAMANAARKEAMTLKPIPSSPSAKKVYAAEAESITSKLNLAERNAPYERQAQLLANAAVGMKRQANPNMEKEEVTKIKQQALNVYRNRTGAGKTKIKLTQEEWNAIQAGAISTDKLKRVLRNSDPDTIKALAIPKENLKMTSSMRLRAQSMLNYGYTQAEVADQLGIGLTTLKVNLSE